MEGIRQKVIFLAAMAISVWLPMGGMGQLNVLLMTSVAFWPVVTIVLQRGICCSSAGISVGVMTSRKASEALSFRRLISVAVS